jgi:hypothetical protein
MNLAGMQRTEGAQKGLLEGLWCYAAGTSETFRTVSLGTSVNKGEKKGRDEES